MRKYAAVVFLITAIAVVVSTAYSSRQDSVPINKPTIKLVVDQTPSQEGPLMVEIVQPAFVSTVGNRIESVSYALKNNTTKKIIALVVNTAIAYDSGGVTTTFPTFSTMDYALHPDVAAQKFFAPGQQVPMDSSSIEFEEKVIIRQIKLRVDYVLFDDNTAYGRGGAGEKKINLMREGARRYKGLLMRHYLSGGQSLSKVITLLESRDSYNELNLTDIDLTLGADRYRLHALKTVRTKGLPEFEKFLR